MAARPVCLDTDICIDFLRKKEPGFTLFTRLIADFEPCITAVTAFELYLGNVKMKRKEKIQDFIAQFSILPFDLESARISADIQASLDRRGEGIGIPDILIAGICIAENTPLATLNTKHFARIEGLKLSEVT